MTVEKESEIFSRAESQHGEIKESEIFSRSESQHEEIKESEFSHPPNLNMEKLVMQIIDTLTRRCAPLAFAPLLALFTREVVAQTRPSSNDRIWVEIGAEANVQNQQCGSCFRQGNAVGPAILGAIGTTLPHGFGLAVAGRGFQEFNTEHTQHSRYVLVLVQYAVPSISPLTVNVGAGHARHDGERTDADRNHNSGPVISAGAALRLPTTSRVAFTLNASVLKTVQGSSNFRPTTATFGIGLNFGILCRTTGC